MPRYALLLILAATVLAAAPASASALDEEGYWAVADRLQADVDRYWDDRAGLYSGFSSGAHSDVLLTLSVAAMRDHHGAARNDRRARRIVDALVSSPPFVATAPPRWKDAQTHAPGFVSSMHSIRSNQHLVVDSEVIDGLRYAWMARRELGLSDDQARAIADRIHRTAMGSYWRWPTIRLNQINWYALVYAANATVTGSPRLLRHDLRLQIERFAARARGSAGLAGNLGAGLHFNYLPQLRPQTPMNTDSAEYANITASFTREYAQARRAGMRPLSPGTTRLMRQWLMRVLAGYWTHGGYMNWDTGYGFHRWHQAKKFGISQQALAQTHGVMFVVRSTALDYHAPARLDDELMVSVVVERLGRASVQFFQEAWRMTPAGRQIISAGRIKVGCVDTNTLRPGAIPDQVLDRIGTGAT